MYMWCILPLIKMCSFLLSCLVITEIPDLVLSMYGISEVFCWSQVMNLIPVGVWKPKETDVYRKSNDSINGWLHLLEISSAAFKSLVCVKAGVSFVLFSWEFPLYENAEMLVLLQFYLFVGVEYLFSSVLSALAFIFLLLLSVL